MTALDERIVVETPGVYHLTDIAYHTDPVPGGSLSCSGAKKLLPPSCPALYTYERANPPETTKTFDIGHAAHKLALGVGPDLVVVDAPDWRSKDAKQARDEIHASGGVPLLPADFAVVNDMARALKEHPIALDLFSDGTPEASLFFRDEPTGIMRRARLDWLPNAGSGRLVVPDYKTTRSADPEQFAKTAPDYGYPMQAAWYPDAITALGIAEDIAFVFVIQMKTAPYLVSVVQLDVNAIRIGRLLNRRAIDLYARCTETGHWPGFVDDVALTSLPFWYERQFEGQI